MKFTIATCITLFLAPIVPSIAAPNPTSTVVPIGMPQSDVVCLGYTVSTTNIEAAVLQGWGWASSVPPIQMGKSSYPHIYNNYEALTFSNCAGSQLWEYPVLRNGANPWVPAKNTQLANEPDRVIFTFSGSSRPTYCGTITHDPNKVTNTGKKGAFVMCI